MKRPSRRAFTLVEILVVLVIIATLIGILLPVLGSARAEGRRTVCTSNLRQIGQALAMYVSDNDSTYPPTFSGDSIWIQKIQPYVPSGNTTYTPLCCPDRQLPGLYGSTNETFPLAAYAYNANLSTFALLQQGKAEPSLQHPATSVSVFDARAGVFALSRPDVGDPEQNSISSLLGAPSGIGDQIKALPEGGRRHQDGANYLFADGHARRLKPEQFDTTETNDGSRPGFGL